MCVGLSKVQDEFLGLVGVELQVGLIAPYGQVVHFLSVGWLTVLLDEANQCGVISKLHDGARFL